MPNHMFVLFDCSASMGEEFRAGSKVQLASDFSGQYQIKFLEAQERLIKWLKKTTFDIVTIIPFHSYLEEPLTASLTEEQDTIASYIRSLKPQGSTNLAEALLVAINDGLRLSEESKESTVRYLIVTDGLSDTRDEDITLIGRIPIIQGVDGILIDPTEPGERHLQRLCVRGIYISVAAPRELEQALETQDQIYSQRMTIGAQYEASMGLGARSLERLERVANMLGERRELNETVRPIVLHALAKAHQTIERESHFRELLADLTVPFAELKAELGELRNKHDRIDALSHILQECLECRVNFKISASYPRLFSKRLESLFLVNIYPFDRRLELEARLKEELREWDLEEKIYDTDLIPGSVVVLKMYSPEIDFSEQVVKELQRAINKVSFIGKPKDTCYPGIHLVNLSISEKSSGIEHDSIQLRVKVVDFAFDHISRPLVSNVVSLLLGLGSVASFVLTFLGDIDKTFGLASGTAAFTAATIIRARFQRLYRRQASVLTLKFM